MITRDLAAMGDKSQHRKPQLWTLIVMLAALTGIVRVAGDAASDTVVLQAFKAGITNSDVLGWSGSDPCAWNAKQVVCDNAGNVLQLRVKLLGLTGTVTPNLNTLASLTYLELNFNSFTGAMPTLQGMASLQHAFLDDNNFDSIPADFFDGLTSIQELWIDNNPLNKSSGGWQMPSTMSSSTLTILSMNNVSSTGSVPSYLGTLLALTTFNAAYNAFSGPIPDSFKTSGIQVLLLNNQANNGLTGSIDFIGGMVGLTKLFLHQNSFTGSVPDGITSAAGLQQFRLSANQLVGRLPLALGNLKSLTDVWVAGNAFSGELPVFPSNATLFIASPGQQSTFCAAAGVPCSTKVDALLDFLAAAGYPQATAVTWVGADPCANPWSGVSCDTAGDVLSIILSKKGLVGTLSPSLANLTSLNTLVVSGNNLTGPIPTELTTLTSLQTVDVSNNNLSPPLPVFPSSVKFTYTPGNPFLTATPPPAVLPPTTPPVTPPVAPATPPATPPPAVPPPTTPPVAPPVTPQVAPPTSPPTIAPVPAPPPAVTAPVPAPTPPLAPAPRSNAPAPGIQLSPSSGPAPAVVIPTTSKKSSVIGLVVGAVAGGIVLCALGSWFFCVYCRIPHKKRTVPTEHQQLQFGALPSVGTTADPEFVKIVVDSGSTNASRHADGQAPESWNMAFTIDQLRTVTENFAERNVLGRGGFGVVYKGVLPDGTKIAVKRMEAAVVSSKGLSEFQSEIAVLTKVKHRHLVGLLGYCTDGYERLLVYEYMSQGTLAQHLFKYEEMTGKPLSWTTRLVIALDVAQGVEYLHTLAHRSFIHRDLKPSNVLLNDEFRAKVSDFGLVKLAPEGNLHSVETRLAGTFGYLAPEYAVTGRVTTKADVFSFGVIMMEILTGRRAVDETLPEEDTYLVSWFTTKMRSGSQEAVLRSIIDPKIGDIDDKTTMKSITTVAELAGHCTAREPSQRPDMGYVVSVLRPLVDEWKPMKMDYDVDTSRGTDMSLTQALKQWQEFKDDSMTSSTVTDNSVNSLPARPGGFADSFASSDGR